MQKHEGEGISYYYNYTYYFHPIVPFAYLFHCQDAPTYFTSET